MQKPYSRLFARVFTCAGVVLALGAVRADSVPRGWVGGTDGLWSTAANWDPSGKPAAGDSITIPAGKGVLVDEATAALTALTVAGSLTQATWNASISATTVTIASAAV